MTTTSLREILLRLPTQPSSLLRAALVCKRWRGLVKDSRFLRRFRAHHGKPPLLGFFLKDHLNSHPFVPSLKPPDRIHAERFTAPVKQGRLPGKKKQGCYNFDTLDCRHGLVLLVGNELRQLLIWDPVTGEQCRVPIPVLRSSNGKELLMGNEGVVRCVNGDQGHVPGHCHSGPFQVALVVSPAGYYCREFVCVYSSAAGLWSDPVSVAFLSQITNTSQLMRFQVTLLTLVGDSLYWLVKPPLCCVLEYDFHRHSLAVIKLPPDVNARSDCVFALMPAEDGGLGLILVSKFRAQLWKRGADSDGAAVWVLGRTIKLRKLRSAARRGPLSIVGFAEDSNAMLVWTASGVFMVDIRSTKIEKLPYSSDWQGFPKRFYPFASFYGAGKGTAGRNDGE